MGNADSLDSAVLTGSPRRRPSHAWKHPTPRFNDSSRRTPSCGSCRRCNYVKNAPLPDVLYRKEWRCSSQHNYT